MVNYQISKVYKLVSHQTDLVYVGSTCEKYLSNRLAGHKKNFNKWKNGKYHYMTSFEIMKYEDCEIILLELFPCESKDQLHARERYWLENTPNTVNKNIPTRTDKEWREANKELLAQKNKVWRDENKEHLQQKKKEYHEENRDRIIGYLKEWRENNKEHIQQKRQERITCECGIEINKRHKARHLKTLKHIQLMNSISPQIK